MIVHAAESLYWFNTTEPPYLIKGFPTSLESRHTTLSASTNVKNSLFLNPVTEVEILQLVAKVKPKKSKGHDELDMCLIKKLIPYSCAFETFI